MDHRKAPCLTGVSILSTSRFEATLRVEPWVKRTIIELSCYPGYDFDEVSVRVAEESVTVVFTNVVRRLDDRGPDPC